jgi:hypothetical protein
MLPAMYDQKIYDLALKKNIVRLRGYNVVTMNPPHLSKTEPYDHYEPRFFHVNEELYFSQATERERQINFNQTDFPLARLEVFTYDRTGLMKIFNPMSWIHQLNSLHYMRIKNFLTRNDVYIKTPMFIHTKYSKENLDKFWSPPNTEEIKQVGEKIDIDIPDFMYKKPEDYLS